MRFESLLPRVSAAKPQESQELSQSLCNDNSNYSLFFLKLVQDGYLEKGMIYSSRATLLQLRKKRAC